MVALKNPLKKVLFSALFLIATTQLSSAQQTTVAEPSLTFYYTPWCYFCQKVLKYLDRVHKVVPMKDVDYYANKEELRSIGGKTQVPCLVIDGAALYESNDIIAWLSAHQDLLDDQ